MAENKIAASRDVVFISKATPGNDEFTLWLAPRLEAAGYQVFADIITLEAGDRWRKTITDTLQNRAIKMLLCCSDETLAKDGVQEEIGIGLDLAKSLPDHKFVIPLRLKPYKKLFGIGELQYIDFVRGWADGLEKLLEALKAQKVPRSANIKINPNWETYKRRKSVLLKPEPERLTSNWLRITEAPDCLRYFEPTGAIEKMMLLQACESAHYPTHPHGKGIITFQTPDEINAALSGVARFELKHEFPLLEFIRDGAKPIGLKGQDASNLVHSMLRQAWNSYCRKRGFLEYAYSAAIGFHVSAAQAKLGARIPWGRQGERRSSALRNVAKGNVWQYGVTAQPSFWPFPHFKLKSRVLFAPPSADDAGSPHSDTKKQHRLRRSVCKGWRNKQWHGRLLAFLELLSGDSAVILLKLAEEANIKLDAAPLLFTSPMSTVLPDVLDDGDEEQDTSTLGRPEADEGDDNGVS